MSGVVGESGRQRTAQARRQAVTEAQLASHYVAMRETLLRDLSSLTTQLAQTRARGEVVSQAWLGRQQRYRTLLQQITAQVDGYAQVAQQQTAQGRLSAALGGMAAGVALIEASVPAAAPRAALGAFDRVPAHVVTQIAQRVGQGTPLGDLFQGWGEAAAREVGQTLVTAIGLGWGPRTTARAMAQTLGDASYARALTIARTEMLGAWRDAQLASYRANADIIGGWLWSATKSPNTCAMCLAMDGTQHSLDESLDSHPNCRCAALPVTKSWSDILGAVGASAEGIRETAITATYQSGSDWFAAQSAETRSAILGPAKAAAYTAGDLTLDDLVGVAHDARWGTSRYEKSLKQLGLKASGYRTLVKS